MIDINKPVFDGNKVSYNSTKDLNWDVVPKGKYNARVVAIYPWKDFEKDTSVKVRDDDGKYIYDGEKFLMEDVKDLKWSMADVTYEIIDGEYAGHALRGNLSTHPDFFGNTKGFVANLGLYDVSLKDLYKHITDDSIVVVNTYNRTRTYKDKDTGMDVTSESSHVSWTDKYDGDNNTDELTGL